MSSKVNDEVGPLLRAASASDRSGGAEGSVPRRNPSLALRTRTGAYERTTSHERERPVRGRGELRSPKKPVAGAQGSLTGPVAGAAGSLRKFVTAVVTCCGGRDQLVGETDGLP